MFDLLHRISSQIELGIDSSVSSISMVQASSRAGSAIGSVVRADRDYAEDIFAELRAGSISGAGVTRDAYGKGEQLAHDLVVRHALALGLEIKRDAACNTYMTLPGRDRSLPSVIVGSHLDSVANGGNSMAPQAFSPDWLRSGL